MGCFDHLIKKGKDADIEKEYIYNLDMYWIRGKSEHQNIENGSIVTNVSKQNNGSYEFTIKDSGIVGYCNYHWAFIENNEGNRHLLSEYESKKESFLNFESKVKELLKTL